MCYARRLAQSMLVSKQHASRSAELRAEHSARMLLASKARAKSMGLVGMYQEPGITSALRTKPPDRGIEGSLTQPRAERNIFQYISILLRTNISSAQRP